MSEDIQSTTKKRTLKTGGQTWTWRVGTVCGSVAQGEFRLWCWEERVYRAVGFEGSVEHSKKGALLLWQRKKTAKDQQ